MKLRIINAQQAGELLGMAECIDVMEEAMLATSTGSVIIPPRLLFGLAEGNGFFANMPGSSADALGSKIVSFLPGNPARGRPAVSGYIGLFDPDSGLPTAIVEGRTITELRTAAASAMATRHLSREDSRRCGIFGTGRQAQVHIEAICAVRPIEEVVIWGRNLKKAEALALENNHRHGARIRATADPADAAACDIVCTCTLATEPILKGSWIRPGAHICLVGAYAPNAREADTALIARAKVYVDSRESAANEAGDILIPIREGAISDTYVVGEIGEVLSGAIRGREAEEEITVYKSLGVVSQDLYAARFVAARAELKGIGTEVDW